MKFNTKDEANVYQAIGQNIKKYRKLKGLTQEQLAEEIDYSLSFISGIESAYHQTFSIAALWRISVVLGVSIDKLCVVNNNNNDIKFMLYQCDHCGLVTKMPINIVKHFKNIYELAGNNKLPTFDCTECDGKLIPVPQANSNNI